MQSNTWGLNRNQQNVYYSNDKDKMIMDIRFEDDNRDGYYLFDKNRLYDNPNYR